MLKRYLAIDLRGYPNEMYEEVYTPERITSPEEGEAIEICLDDLSEIKNILRELGKTKLIFVRGGETNEDR